MAELVIFVRFHAKPGNQSSVERALLDVLEPSRREAGCVSIHAHRSIRDPQLFYLHSMWNDEAAFEIHARLPHTVRFIEAVEPLIDHALEVARTERIG